MSSRLSTGRKDHIFVISNHPIAAIALEGLLRKAAHWDVTTHCFASYMSMLDGAAQKETLLILDKGATTCLAATIRSIKEWRPLAKLIVIGHPLSSDEECLLVYLGIHGFIAYDNVHRDLKQATRAVLGGDLWFSPQHLHNYVEYLSRHVHGHRRLVGTQLTQREQQITRLIQRGLCTSQIGAELNISGSTVKFHVKHILSKLDLKHRREILAYKFQDMVSVNGELAVGTGSLGGAGARTVTTN